MTNPQQEYWSNPHDKPNQPEAYINKKLNNRSEFLFSLIQPLISKDNSILEIGCNAGRNLNFLLGKDYRNLAGIELNENAIKLMNKVYPSLKNIKKGSIENTIPTIEKNSFDLTFSLAVLMHLPYESNFVMKELARITKKYLITIEDERPEILCKTHFPRNYKFVFEKFGFKEISSGKCPIQDCLKDYTWRIFYKIN